MLFSPVLCCSYGSSLQSLSIIVIVNEHQGENEFSSAQLIATIVAINVVAQRAGVKEVKSQQGIHPYQSSKRAEWNQKDFSTFWKEFSAK